MSADHCENGKNLYARHSLAGECFVAASDADGDAEKFIYCFLLIAGLPDAR